MSAHKRLLSVVNRENEYKKQLDVNKENLLNEAEHIVFEKFPKKVLELNALLESGDFAYSRLQKLLPNTDEIVPLSHLELNISDDGYHAIDGPTPKKPKLIQQIGTPVYGFVGGSVKCNMKLAELTSILRPLLREAVEDVNKIQMWIIFLIPRIEDGNNFGVSIQEECLSEVRNVESEAASFLDHMSLYFVNRARLVTKVAKYPHVDDYRRAILDMDEKQFINIRLVLMELRNHFATLHDMILKNFEKIKKPRSGHVDSIY
uniref:Proteasome activator complex subunit 3 n=1 Tax=Acrobeloides nanus TaxID=290746 RepID=A0A914CUB9_9BILA